MHSYQVMCAHMSCLMASSQHQRILIISNNFRYTTKLFALQDFPTTAVRVQYDAQGVTAVHAARCVHVCVHLHTGGKREGEREPPDLKRQIRASLKSITGEPCTDFISWKTCAAKGMQTDIDFSDWLISSFLKNVHTELQCRVCFGFVCFLGAHSVLNTSMPVTFILEK